MTLADADHGHEPVLVAPLLRLLDPQPGNVVFDGTVGLGGHAAAILPRIAPGGRYIGLDIDGEMLAAARPALTPPESVSLHLIQASYAAISDVLRDLGMPAVDRALLDLGVNSRQLDDPARGFSFDRDGPLDMRFDRGQKEQAMDLVNRLSESELADLFYEFGQEGASRKIARKICQVRHEGRITTTKALARAVESVFAGGHVRQIGKIHPATRVFQALRVAVNRELDNLGQFVAQIGAFLRPGGRVAILSFHSLEDGMVKRAFRAAKPAHKVGKAAHPVGQTSGLPSRVLPTSGLPGQVGQTSGLLEELTKRPEVADEEERRRNPRSRSAKLRVAQRID